jgi:hypothetical protein
MIRFLYRETEFYGRVSRSVACMARLRKTADKIRTNNNKFKRMHDYKNSGKRNFQSTARS